MSAADARCPWCLGSDLYIAYHDEEWGVPQHDDRHLFEMIILEGAQAGLSWSTILNKRETYRAAFDNFDAEKVARYGDRKVAQLLANPGIVRNRLKVAASIKNAQACLEVRREFGSLDAFLWQFVGGQPIQNKRRGMKEIPARSAESDAMSKALLKRGFKFVGSTICYAFMQAVGMVNDHLITCPRHAAVTKLANANSKRTRKYRPTPEASQLVAPGRATKERPPGVNQKTAKLQPSRRSRIQ